MQKLLSVSQINKYIKGVFEDELILHNIAVFGEICDYSVRGNNAYFILRDETDRLSCVQFKYDPSFPVSNGMKVKATGTCAYYTKGGKMNFNVFKLEPFGEGEIALRKKQLFERLKAEGIFDTKKPMPKTIKTIGVVTSISGAVMHDIINVVSRRDKSVSLMFFDARVQGEGADIKICAGIEELTRQSVDAIIIARGGGAGEDLDIFNSEKIARKIAACKIFTVSAIGHETDTTIADFSSDLRAPTPSAAAELLTKDYGVQYGKLLHLTKMLKIRFFELYQRKLSRFNNATKTVEILSFQRLTTTKKELSFAAKRLYNSINNKHNYYAKNVKLNGEKMHSIINKKISEKSQLIELNTQLINKLNPLKILKRGYAKVYYQNNPIYSINDVDNGQNIDIYMADGTISAKTENKEKYKKNGK